MSYQGRQALGLKIKLRTATGADAVKATKTKGTGDAKIVFTAKTAGVAGNGISVAVVNPGGTSAPSVSVDGLAITINAGVTSDVIDSDVNEIIAAVYASAAAAALIDVTNGDGDGTSNIVAFAAENLASGADATHTYEEIPGLGDVTIPGLNRGTVDFTNHGSTSGYAEVVKSAVKEVRELSAPINFDPANSIHQALKAAELSDDPVSMQFVFTVAGLDFQSSALVLDIPLENAVRGIFKTTMKLVLTGAPVSI